MGNKPVKRIRAKKIVASIFENTGRNGTFHTYTLSRLYKTPQGWRSSSNFGREDTWEVLAAAVQAEAWIRAEEREADPVPTDDELEAGSL